MPAVFDPERCRCHRLLFLVEKPAGAQEEPSISPRLILKILCDLVWVNVNFLWKILKNSIYLTWIFFQCHFGKSLIKVGSSI